MKKRKKILRVLAITCEGGLGKRRVSVLQLIFIYILCQGVHRYTSFPIFVFYLFLAPLNCPTLTHLAILTQILAYHLILTTACYLSYKFLTNISPHPLLSKLVLGLRDPRAPLYEPYCLEFGCFIWFHLVVVVLMLCGYLFSFGYEVDKGFGIFMGLSEIIFFFES